MRNSRLILFPACVALAGAVTTGAAASAGSDCRSQETGKILALGPGFLVHGLGRYYAGNTTGATSLAGGEALALGLAHYSGGIVHFGRDNTPMAILAVGVFLATWVIDIVRTPDDINRWNRAHGCGGPSPIAVGAAAPAAPLPAAGPTGPMARTAPAYPVAIAAPSSTMLVIAIVPFNAVGVAPADALNAADRVGAELAGVPGVRVLDRARVEALMGGQVFPKEGCISAECATWVGRLVKADLVVVGSEGFFLGAWTVTAGIVDAATGRAGPRFTAGGATAAEALARTGDEAARMAREMR